MRRLWELLKAIEEKWQARKVRNVSWCSWLVAVRRDGLTGDKWMEAHEVEQREYWTRVRGDIPKVVSIRRSR